MLLICQRSVVFFGIFSERYIVKAALFRDRISVCSVRLSVCLSVCPSVTLQSEDRELIADSINTTR